MKPPWYMKISFKEQTPEYRGFFRGGWVKVPPCKEVGLPCNTWASFHFLYRMYLLIVFLTHLRISRKHEG